MMSSRRVGLSLIGLSSAFLVAAPSAFAAGDGHATPWLAIIVNLTIFFGILGYLVVPKIRTMLTERSQQIIDDLSAAERARQEAEARLAEMDAKLAAVDGQVDEILEAAKQQAAAESERILAQAETEAAKVLEQAEVQVGDLQTSAVRRLRATAADLAVDLAEELLAKNLGNEDRARLFDDYLQGLSKVAS